MAKCLDDTLHRPMYHGHSGNGTGSKKKTVIREYTVYMSHETVSVFSYGTMYVPAS